MHVKGATEMFQNYPDVVNVKQMREMLDGIGRNTAYKMLSEETIKSKKIGRKYFVPKENIVEFLKNK